MTSEYISELIKTYPEILEVWLIGSRSQGTQRRDSDWDYLVFANMRILRSLRQRKRFHLPDIDPLIIYDGNNFVKPWIEDSKKKKGSLTGWGWQKVSPTRAKYKAAKWSEDGNFTSEAHGIRVWPQSGAEQEE